MKERFDDIIDFQQFTFKIIQNWFVITISLIIALIVAFGINRYSHEKFYSETAILIKESNSTINPSDLLYESPSNSQKKSLENKALLLRSYPLLFQTVKDLRFNISYYIVGSVMVTETYTSPIIFDCENTNKLTNKSFLVTVLNDSLYKIEVDGEENSILYRFGEYYSLFSTNFKVDLDTKYPFLYEKDKIVYSEIPQTIIKFRSLKNVALSYQNRIKINQKDKQSTVINISVLEEDQLKGVIFLNKLAENYIKYEVEEKNVAANNTVNFINSQLKKMSDSLSLIEVQIEQYKNNNNITDLSLKAQSIYSNIVQLETQLAKNKSIRNYYLYLENYLSKDNDFDGLSLPASFEVEDLSLNILIKQLLDIQLKKNILKDGGQINNPAIAKYNRQSKQLILNLKETIKTSKETNNLVINDFKRRIRNMELSLNNIPQVERELLSIERLQSISENIYIFLLKKRAEAKITSSSNVSDSKVLEPAIYNVKNPVFPDKNKNYLFAIILGFFIPILFLFIKDLINDKIITRSDLERITKIPVLAAISRNYSGSMLLSQLSPKSVTFEGFRALRSNLSFLKDSNPNNKVYLVTSSVSGEGKTYIAENLAIVFAKSGKKTIIIGADLRRPKIYSDFNLNNKVGVSNYILKELSLNEVVLDSNLPNLDILVSGPLPHDPAELLLSKRFKELISKLKKEYDTIIIDTPPLGLVADSLTLMEYSDVNLYVVRQDYTRKKILNYVDEMFTSNRIQNIHIILNDIQEGTGAYGYGYGYGYGYSNSYGNSNDSNYFEE